MSSLIGLFSFYFTEQVFSVWLPSSSDQFLLLFKTQLSLSKTFESENVFCVYNINIPEIILFRRKLFSSLNVHKVEMMQQSWKTKEETEFGKCKEKWEMIKNVIYCQFFILPIWWSENSYLSCGLLTSRLFFMCRCVARSQYEKKLCIFSTSGPTLFTYSNQAYQWNL